ncbi:PAS domain-containing sensor histidine kinase [Larkinella sp. VNQ87]|uniref:sensor histidine kinase n=1 Tax=Larkinella sp. VNQ87 TaxID=3400921 RepID=UPI003C0FD088
MSIQQQMEEQYRLLVENAREYCVFLLDIPGTIQTWNPGGHRLLGYSSAEAIKKPVFDFYYTTASDRRSYSNKLTQAIEQGRFEEKTWLLRKNQSRFWAQITLTPIYEKDQLSGFGGVIHDLTEEKHYENRPQESHQREDHLVDLLSTLIEQSPVGISLFTPVFDEQGRVSDFLFKLTNPANAKTGGLAVEKLINQTLKTVFPQAGPDVFWQNLLACFQSGQPQTLNGHFTAFGLDIWIDGHFHKVGDDVLWIGLDVTELKKAKAQLESQLSNLQDAKEQVDVDIDRLKIAELEVNRALEKEREANQLKTEFINLVSHQFRTPMTSISLKAEALKRFSERSSDRVFARRVADYTEQVTRDIHRISKLITEVLFNDRIQSGQMEIRRKQLDLVEFCQHLIIQQRQLDPAYQRIVFTSNVPTLPVWVDPVLFEQVLENLMNNALKYSAESDKPVELTLSELDGEWRLYVLDHGIGIPADELKHVKKSFFRGSNTADYPGTGLGLSLSQRIVEMHGGKLTIESELGHYTRCTLTMLKKPQSKESESS